METTKNWFSKFCQTEMKPRASRDENESQNEWLSKLLNLSDKSQVQYSFGER